MTRLLLAASLLAVLATGARAELSHEAWAPGSCTLVSEFVEVSIDGPEHLTSSGLTSIEYHFVAGQLVIRAPSWDHTTPKELKELMRQIRTPPVINFKATAAAE